MSARKRPGRSKGAKTIKDVVDVQPSRCPNLNCRSSRRTEYTNTYYRDFSGQGMAIIGYHYRACKCLDCGQARRDREPVYSANENVRVLV